MPARIAVARRSADHAIPKGAAKEETSGHATPMLVYTSTGDASVWSRFRTRLDGSLPNPAAVRPAERLRCLGLCRLDGYVWVCILERASVEHVDDPRRCLLGEATVNERRRAGSWSIRPGCELRITVDRELVRARVRA